MPEPQYIVIITLTFLIAGTVKGVIGLGLPTISLTLLTATIGLHPAMALMLVPSFVTNVWQAASGGNGRVIIRRTWPFLLAATLTVWLGAEALESADVAYLSALLGVLVVAYSAIALATPHIEIPKSWESWAGPLAGSINGVLTGMTGAFVFPGILYLQALGLSKDVLVQAMGLLFTCSTVALAVALGGRDMLSTDLGLASLASVLPALVGMTFGQRLRRNLSEILFKRILFSALLLLGIYIIARSLL